MLGEENMGWYVGAMGLNLDRVGASRYLLSVKRDEDIVNWVKENDLDGYSIAEQKVVLPEPGVPVTAIRTPAIDPLP